ALLALGLAITRSPGARWLPSPQDGSRTTVLRQRSHSERKLNIIISTARITVGERNMGERVKQLDSR
ncbi:hypothetical protein ADUPG1_009579, partial [Aduncisulcus paluster]